jgi:alkanesulfonate monooxygenase SsuD/methylene tetrahydromethanopterin reductase-like flavin-dependent oxidoreductase (luciferase family)
VNPERPLQLGIALRPGEGRAEWERAFDRVERAEALGLHSVWVPEGHFHRGAMAAPLVALSAFAARTRRLRLGTTSLLLPIHHPRRIAAEVAALDRLSGGRVILGLGRGFRSPVFRGFGVAAATKRDRFDAALDVILEAWSTNTALRPVQQPHPPLVVAAFGPKGLRQAALRGLPYLASPIETLDALAENWRLWREQAPGPPAGVPVMRTVFVAETERDATRVRDALQAELARLAPGAPRALVRAADGRLEDRVVVGRAPAVRETLERYRERLGMDLLVARLEVPGVPEAAAEGSLDRLVGDVLPGLGSPLSPPPPLG